MLIEFNLTMPTNNAWNGQWTGQGKLYAIIKNLKPDLGNKVLAKNSYWYRWDDGWSAKISVRRVYSKEAVKIRKQSAGFCGYEWMVKSIIKNQTITAKED